MMAFLKVLVINGARFARTIFFFKSACLFKASKKTLSKGAYSSIDCGENL